MNNSALPPAYNSPTPSKQVDANNTEALPPPNYTPPTKFTIIDHDETTRQDCRSRRTSCLTTCFFRAEEPSGHVAIPVLHVPADKKRKWAWFVALAVERFNVRCQDLKPSDESKSMKVVLPPIDVLMVWHANPRYDLFEKESETSLIFSFCSRWYAGGCVRISACIILKGFEGHFSALLEDPTSPLLTEAPTQAHQDFWFSRTSLPFDPFEGMKSMTEQTIFCPKCNASVATCPSITIEVFPD